MKTTAFLRKEIIVAVDIGTTKICVIVARINATHDLEIIGIGQAPSHGLSKGIVVDMNKTVESIKKAIQEAEIMSGYQIESVVIGISGSHIQALNSQGIVPIKKSVITHHDITNVIAAAQAIPIAQGKQILHVLPQYFTVDSQERVRNPIGMHGIRLEAQVHVITGSVSCVQNLINCCHMAGVQVDDIVLEQVASALAVLSPDERQLGVGVLDIGGGTSDLALYSGNSIFYTMVIPVAGNHFTHDLSLGLRSTTSQAERIKKQYGIVFRPFITQEELIDVESIEGHAHRQVSINQINDILEPRAHELFMLIEKILNQHHLKPLIPAGLVLTGGSCLLTGIKELAESILHINVRIGKPHITQPFLQILDSPIYATGYGLLLYVINKRNTESVGHMSEPLLVRVATRMKSWITDLF